MALDAGNLDARNALGGIKLMENDAAGALVEFQSILALNPENNPALFGRGLAKRGLGDAAGGNTDMTGARRAAPAVSNDFWDAGLVPNP